VVTNAISGSYLFLVDAGDAVRDSKGSASP
jgi:hypothetical protein